METEVTIEWRTTCFECGNVHEQESQVTEGYDYARDRVHNCEVCGKSMTKYNSACEFTVVECEL